MIPDEFKCYIQSTHRESDSHFRYMQKTIEKILEWGEKWQPDSVKLFKLILRRIKGDKKYHKKHINQQGKDVWYVSLPLAGTNKQMMLFFDYPDPQKGIEYFILHDFKVV